MQRILLCFLEPKYYGGQESKKQAINIHTTPYEVGKERERMQSGLK